MIYFIQRITGGSIKIGTSICLKKRLQELGYQTRATLKVLGVMDGGRLEEQGVHIKFHKLRIAGEWFNPEPELLTFIKEHAHDWNGLDEDSSNESEYLTISSAARLLKVNRYWLHAFLEGMASIGDAQEPIRVGSSLAVRREDILKVPHRSKQQEA